jgi:diguanylate cyclase (GGDEF)-like protein/PAS domain S-box-containing protein
MHSFLHPKRKAPQRRSMDPFWGVSEVGPEWTDLVSMAAQTWQAAGALLLLKQPTGEQASYSHGETTSLEWQDDFESLEEGHLLVPDVQRDGAWGEHPVLRARGYRFLAATIIPAGDGEPCGSLWLFGDAPRTPGAWEQGALRLLRQQAAALRRLEEQIHARRNEESHYRTILESLVEGVVFVDPDARILACNRSAERILGLTQDQMAQQRAVDGRFTAIHEDGSPFSEDAHPSVRALRTGKPQLNVVQGIPAADGRTLWVSINAQPLQHPWEAKPHGAVVSLFDITRLKEVEARLRHEATRDPLTGLLSRRPFMEGLSAALKTAKRHGDPLCLAMGDLDHFKAVNDHFGHATGDQALALTGRVLTEELRGEDLAGRFGGDEFCILFSRSRPEEARACLERIRARLEREVLATDLGPCRLTATFGLAPLAGLSMSEQELFETADRALYQAKHLGRNRVESCEAVLKEA